MAFGLAFLLALSALAAGSDFTSGKQILTPAGFEYLGSIASSNGDHKAINENDYFVSTGSATWTEAEKDCVRVFGTNSGLVAIESQSENDQINRFLERYGSGSSHWIGGMYDRKNNAFIWSTTGAKLPSGQGWSYNPWSPNQPPSSATVESRTFVIHESRFSSQWSTALSTRNLRYICEKQLM